MSTRILAVLCALALPATGAFAGEASGSFSNGSRTFSPKAASAIEIRDSSMSSRSTGTSSDAWAINVP